VASTVRTAGRAAPLAQGSIKLAIPVQSVKTSIARADVVYLYREIETKNKAFYFIRRPGLFSLYPGFTMKRIFLFTVISLGAVPMAVAKDPQEFDKLWNYSDPAATDAKFRALVSEAERGGEPEYQLQLLTQLARTQSLQGKFAEAHSILDGVEKELGPNTPVAEVRYLLERGRTFNSAMKTDEASRLFLRAFELGEQRRLDVFAIDAAHMMAIAEQDRAKQMEWNLKGVALAERSKDERAQNWLGSLYNNIGWTYHDVGKFDDALATFQKALAFREQKGEAGSIRTAKWCVGRCLRLLHRNDEAMKIQRDLEGEYEKLAMKDGYVFEEIAELLALQQDAEAKRYFRRAYAELLKDDWLKQNEAKRLERLRELGGE
jgi:tetratricopeptide (TPR) repeat protein